VLVLSRKKNETIVINGNIRVTVSEVRGEKVRLAFDVPRDIPIVREELIDKYPKTVVTQ